MNTSRLVARCRKLPWTIVAVSGVRKAGADTHGVVAPLIRAGMNPSVAAA